MHSQILSVLEIDTTTLFFSDRLNLYHNGDAAPFANLVFKDGKASLRVNSGETFNKASSVFLGYYDKQ